MIHQYKLNGYNIVLDVSSGAIHSVDELAYDIISMFESESAETIIEKMLEKYEGDPEIDEWEISSCIDDVRELKEKGKLFSGEIYSVEDGSDSAKKGAVKALCLHVAHTCNLSCEYCFAAQGRYNGERELMSLDVGRRAIDFLIENSDERRNLEVDFFGGEPLMNWDVVKALVEYARSKEEKTGKRFRFTLTTNGVLSNGEVIEFANREMSNVVLSLDGRPEIHDSQRKTAGGEGSYALAVPKLLEFVKGRGERDYYIRGTFTHANTDFTEDIFHMAELGFTRLSMEPVVSSPEDPYALTKEDLPVLLGQYELLAKEMIKRKKEGRPFTFYHYMLDLECGPCIYKRMTGCGSGTEYFAVTPRGELFPCHQFVGNKEYSMGNVWDGVTNTALLEKFSGLSANSRPECRACWARLYCSGGCAANAHRAAGDITKVYEYGCELFRKRIECAIMIKVAENL